MVSVLAPLFIAAILGYPSPLREEPSSSWVGRTVIMKKTGTRFFRNSPDGAAVEIGLLMRTDYVVVRERDGKIWVKQDGVEGWIPTEDAALPEGGVEHFSKLIMENPNDSSQYARRSKAYELKGDLDAALKDYDEALRISPTSSSWWNNRANLYSKKKDYDRAIADYDRSIELNASSAIVWGNRGNAHAHKLDFEKAIRNYDEALRLNTNYINSLANRGNAWRDQREFDKALADYAAALKIDPDFSFAFSNRAALWMLRKDYEKAAEDIHAAVRCDPRSATAFLQRGLLRRVQELPSLALDDFSHAIWLDPRLTLAYVKRGEYRQLLKQPAEALKDFETALTGEPRSLTALSAKAWLLATCPDRSIRDGVKALELAKQAVEIAGGKSARALVVLAAAQAEREQFDDAMATQKQAMDSKDLAPDDRPLEQKRLEAYQKKMPWREE